MAKLPNEVVDALELEAAANCNRITNAAADTLRRLFKRVAEIFSSAAEDGHSSEVELESSDSSESTAETPAYGFPPAYGYPPAYGVPASVAVQLLLKTATLLSDLTKKLRGENKQAVEALLEEIGKALGLSSNADLQGQIRYGDPLQEMRLAVSVSVGTQPVRDPIAAGDALSNAWNELVEVIKASEWQPEGSWFDKMLTLCVAIDCAVKALRAVGVGSQVGCNEETEKEDNDKQEASAANDAAVVEQKADNLDEQMQAQSDSSSEQVSEQVSEQASIEAMASTANTTQQSFVVETIANLNNELKRISETVEQLINRVNSMETIIKDRRRVTSFAAASATINNEKEDESEDLLSRWYSARSESEKRRILREAQSLLARPTKLSQ